MLIFLNVFLFNAFSEKENHEDEIPAALYTARLSPVFPVEIPENLTFALEEVPLDNFMVARTSTGN